MPLKIALANPVGFRSLSEAGPHLGLAYLGGACSEAGHAVRVFDLNHPLSPGEDEAARTIAEWTPRIVGLTVTSFNVQAAHRFGVLLRRMLPDAFMLAGGVHPTLAPEHFLSSGNRAFDCVAIGEGEVTLVELAACLEGGGDPEEVPGLAFLDADGFRLTPPRALACVDALAAPDFDVFEPQPDLESWYPIVTSRGCPHACAFCVSKTFWKQSFRARGAGSVVAEILGARNRYGSRSIRVYDDNFALDRARALEICASLRHEGADLSLVNGVRADSIDDALVAALVEAGLDFTMLGVEDGNPETFEKIGKGETLADIERAVGILKRHGMRTEATMVIGLEGTTFETTMRSLSFLEHLEVPGHWIVAVPFAGTALLDYARRYGRLFSDPLDGFRESMVEYPPLVAFETPEFTRAERLAAYEKTNLVSGNYHFLARTDEHLADAAERIAALARRLDPDNAPLHDAAVVRKFGLPQPTAPACADAGEVRI